MIYNDKYPRSLTAAYRTDVKEEIIPGLTKVYTETLTKDGELISLKLKEIRVSRRLLDDEGMVSTRTLLQLLILTNTKKTSLFNDDLQHLFNMSDMVVAYND